MGILKLQRTVTAAIKAGMVGQAEIGPRAVEDGLNLAQGHDNAMPKVEVPVPIQQPLHDEL